MTYVLLLDFSKAFDKVPHSRLYLKFQHYDIDESILLWIKSFLNLSIPVCAVIDSKILFQHEFISLCGMQGTVVALLFVFIVH